MTACIYYDLEEVSLADIARARIAAPGALEFIPRGARWPEEADGPRPAEVCSSREIDYQQRVMLWVDEVFEALEQSEARSFLLRGDGISLLEILRYRFFFEFAEIEQRLAAVSAMAEKGAERICWVVAQNEAAAIGKLTNEMVSPRIDVVGVHRSVKSPNRLWRWFRSLGRRAVDRLMNTADTIGRNPQRWVSQAGESIAIVEYYPNSAKALVPVSRALREQYGVDTIWIAGRREVKQTLERHGVESVLMRQLTPRSNRVRKHFGSAATRALRDAIDSLPDKIFCGTGSLFGKPMLISGLTDKLSEYAEEAAFWFDSLSEAFAAVRPRCVVSTTYGSTTGRAAALAARHRGIQSAFVQHGIIPDYDCFARFCNDLICVWGHAQERTLARNGIAVSRIKVVGAAPYDDLVRRVVRAGPSKFPRPGDPLKVAYMASRTAGQVVSSTIGKQLCMVIRDAILRIPGATLTVKRHPADKTRIIETLLEGSPRVHVVCDGNSQDVILQSDVVIVASSTTGLETCIADKPLIVVETIGLSEYGPYRGYGAALHVCVDGQDAADRLRETILRLASDPALLGELSDGRRRLIDDLLNGGKGDATKLTAEAIAGLWAKTAERVPPKSPANL